MKKTFDSRHHAHDVQAIVGSGFSPLRRCVYWLLRIGDAPRAQRWLQQVLQQGLVKSVADLERDSPSRTNAGALHTEVVMLAATYAGLMTLGLREHADFPFPSAFKGGMALRDASDAPAGTRWDWGDCPDGEVESASCVHLLAAHYYDAYPAASACVMGSATMEAHGIEVVSRVAACPSYIQREQDKCTSAWHAYEPFGFRDGIGQPTIRGLRLRAEAPGAACLPGATPLPDHLVAAGEFVLGHTTEYGEPAYCPDIATGAPSNGVLQRRAFGFNGSYLAVRQIRQHVDAFRAFEASCAAASGPLPLIVERMIGRRKDGTALVPVLEGATQADAFRYRLEDQDGFQCPRGSHVRRANPRDMLGWDTESGLAAAKLHRILRRGRVYSDGTSACGATDSPECGAPQRRADCGKGLFFMALNADLERQFEFVQQRWLAGANFADLRDETDPLFAAPPPRSFSLPGVPVGQRLQGLKHFTQDIGGGYFFVPGLASLRVMAGAAQ